MIAFDRSTYLPQSSLLLSLFVSRAWQVILVLVIALNPAWFSVLELSLYYVAAAFAADNEI
jgi:hypothetical protein